MSQSISVMVHNPEVEDVVYFPPSENSHSEFSRVRMSEKGNDLTLMFNDPQEAYDLAEAIVKAGDLISIGGYSQRKWIPRSKREGN